ncbi:hypothetical protein FHU30_002635 [Actinomadura rupiterrae]|nr:hypothetical protein [Actinomadura rupiterrae]
MAAAFCIQGVFGRFGNQGSPSARAFGVRLACFVAVVSVMAGLIFSANPRDAADFIEVNAKTGAVLGYLLLNLCYLCIVMTQAIGVTFRFAPQVSSSALRLGLRLVACGSTCGLTFCLYKSLVAVSAFLELKGRYFEKIIGPSLGLLAAALIVAGLTIASLGPGAADAVRQRAAIKSLEPMWLELTQAMPQVVLKADHQNRTERLYRKIIEIRDAQLALNAYQDDELRCLVRKTAQVRGLCGSRLDAAVEGTLLSLALAAMKAGREAAASSPVKDLGGRPSPDLMSECQWLVQVSEFFRSPLLEDSATLPV